MPFRTSRLNLGDLTAEEEPKPVRIRIDTMDALSITSAVLSINKKCCSTASTLHEIRTKIKDAPSTITSICSQTTVISASLSHLQYLILSKEDLTAVLERRPDLASALDCSMIGCVMLFSCLDDEIARVVKVAQSGNFNWRGKARLWNQETLKNMLEDLRSQQAALVTLISLLQVDSMSDMKSLLEKNKATFEATMRRTSTLRKSNPNVKVRKSIYAQDDLPNEYSFSIAPSSPGCTSPSGKASEFQFDFEDLVKNSRVYQQMLTKDKLTENERSLVAAEGDLIDLSDDKTIDNERQQDSDDAALQQMQELVIAEDEEEPSDDDNRPSITPRSPPRLELPNDFSGSFDLEQASEPNDEGHASTGLPVSRFAIDNGEPDDDDDEPRDETPSPPTNDMLSTETQVRTLSKYDPVIFDAPIPAHEMPDFDFAVTPATPVANVQMQHKPEPEPEERSRRSGLISPSPEPEMRSNQTSPTPSGSFYSTSTSPDLRRHTSSLEVDFSKSPVPDMPEAFSHDAFSHIDRRFQRTPSLRQESSRDQPTSPTPSTSTQKSASPDARRKTSTLELDPVQPGSREKQKLPDAWTFYSRPSSHRERSSTSAADYRKEQTSPVPNSSYYGRQTPSTGEEVYPRPQLDRNPSFVDTQASHDSSHQPKNSSNTLRKAFFKRKPSTTQYCYRCKGSITGTFITAMGVAFHNGCFRCADCSRMLDSTAFPFRQTLRDGSQETIPLCEIDYFQRLDPICRACGNPLCGSFMAAFEGTRKDHLAAFSCGQCEKVFKAPYSYFKNPKDGRVYC